MKMENEQADLLAVSGPDKPEGRGLFQLINLWEVYYD